MNQYSVLQNFKPSDLRLSPFPYIVIDEVLPWDLYNKLEAEYPEQYMTKGETHGFGTARYVDHDFDTYATVSQAWQEFAAYSTSREFKNEVIFKISVDINGKQEYSFMEKDYDQLCDKLTDIMIRETL